MNLPYRTHCAYWYDTDLFKATGDSSSLYLENVKFVEIRARYKSLIYLQNSHNLIMQNCHFEKIEVRPRQLEGVIKIGENEYLSMECPSSG